MEDHTREHLNDLLRQFLTTSEAEVADRAIQEGERILDDCPAPTPDSATIIRIKREMVVTALRRRRVVRIIRRSLAAAAVIVFAVFGLMNRGHNGRTDAFQAAILPAVLWETDNIAADDLDLTYFTTQVRQLEAQLQAIDATEDEPAGDNTIDDLATELIQIDGDFWKG